MTHKQRQIKTESFAPVAAPAALLPQVPTPKYCHIQTWTCTFFSLPACKLLWFAAGLATAPGVAISATRGGGQPGRFCSPVLLPFSSRINITCLSGRYDIHRQNAGANTRVPWSCSQPNVGPIHVGSAPEDGPLVLRHAPYDALSHRTTASR